MGGMKPELLTIRVTHSHDTSPVQTDRVRLQLQLHKVHASSSSGAHLALGSLHIDDEVRQGRARTRARQLVLAGSRVGDALAVEGRVVEEWLR